MRESRPMPAITSGRFRAHALADIGDLVGEADLHGQERVGGVLDHFRAGERGGRPAAPRVMHAGRGTPGGGSNDLRRPAAAYSSRIAARVSSSDAPTTMRSGIERIGDGAAFAQELGIAGHAEADVAFARSGCASRNALAHQRLHQVAASPPARWTCSPPRESASPIHAAPMLRAAASR